MDRIPSLIEIATAIADGRPVDWTAIEARVVDPVERRRVDRLRILEQIAHTHAVPGKEPAIGLSDSPSSRSQADSLPDEGEPAPLRWGHLTILRRIGGGAFGDVYLAHDPHLDRRVALKLLRHRERQTEAVERSAIEEGRLLARIEHPNVVTVYGAERNDGRVGLWMEHIDGETLEERVQRCGPFASDTVAKIGAELCGALDAVHRAGLLHRDLKAQNVMYAKDGRAVLIDFGEGKDLREGESGAPRNSIELAGTPLYLAPEVLNGRPTSPQSEVYCLGVLLYHLASGSFPVRGRTLGELRDAHSRGLGIDCQEAAPTLAHDLAAVIRRALLPDPSQRYQSANDLQAALPVAWRVNRRRVRRGIIAAVLLLTCLGAGGVWKWRDTEGLLQSRRLAAQSQEAFRAGDLDVAVRLAIESAEQLPTDEAEVALRTVLTGPLEHCVLNHGGWVTRVAFSPTGRRIVTASADHTAREWDADTCHLLATLTGHNKGVSDAVFSSDGKRIITVSWDGTARVWDAATGQSLKILGWPTSQVFRAAISPDGRSIVAEGSDHLAQLWDAGTGQLRATLTGHSGTVLDAAFSPNSRRIVTASSDRTARVWDAETGRLLLTLTGHSAAVQRATFSSDSQRIVTASADQTARVWDADTGRLRASLTGHIGSVAGAAFSPDGTHVVTASDDHTARVWDADTGRPLVTLTGHIGSVSRAAFSPDGARLVTASADRTSRVWNADTGQPLATLPHHESVDDASFSPDGRWVVTASEDGTARVWDATYGHPLSSVAGHPGLVPVAALSPDGKRMVVTHRLAIVIGHATSADDAAFSPTMRMPQVSLPETGSTEWIEQIWNADTGQPLAALSPTNFAVFSADGTRIVTAQEGWGRRTPGSHPALVWNSATGQRVATLTGHTAPLAAAVFSPDGKRIVTAGSDGPTRVWDVASAKQLATLNGDPAGVFSLAFSPDGRRVVAFGPDGTAREWWASTGQLIAAFPGPARIIPPIVPFAAFSPDGRRIVTATGADGMAKLWDANTGQRLASPVTGLEYFAAFSSDRKRVISAHGEHTAQVWDVDTGRLDLTLTGHSDRVVTAAFSPDGNRIVTGSWDGTARLWDAGTGRALGVLAGATREVLYVAFSPDGERIVTGSRDGAARVYMADLKELLLWVKSHLVTESGK